MQVDEFSSLRQATEAKRKAQLAWEAEIVRMRKAGWSTRALADPPGVSHMTVSELPR